MEDTKDQMSEALLDGWLQMSTAISNERLVKAMTYNESMVCGFLYRQRKEEGEALTATELCRRLSMKKSQMNLEPAGKPGNHQKRTVQAGSAAGISFPHGPGSSFLREGSQRNPEASRRSDRKDGRRKSPQAHRADEGGCRLLPQDAGG